MTKAQFKKAVRDYYRMKMELDKLKASIEDYMVENSTIDEVVDTLPDGQELAVTYNDGYISTRINSAQVRKDYEAMGREVPTMEVTVSKQCAIKARKPKKK